MKSILLWKFVPVVLALSFALPAHVFALEVPPPVGAEELEDLLAAIDSSIANVESYLEETSPNPKAAKLMAKGNQVLESAKAQLLTGPFPKNLKKVSKLIAKWAKLSSKALKKSTPQEGSIGLSVPGKSVEREPDIFLVNCLNNSGVLLFAALYALIALLLVDSLVFYALFTKKIEKKHIKMEQLRLGALGLLAPGAVALTLSTPFVWGGNSAKGAQTLAKAMALGVILYFFLLAQLSSSSLVLSNE